MTTVRAVVTGRVQGVGFRAWTRREATRLGLAGWVRNRRDGTVEAVLAGREAAVARMLAALRHGPPSAEVTAVAEHEADPLDAGADAGEGGFEERPTI